MPRICSRIVLIALAAAFAPIVAAATADIRDTPGGKRLLFIDGDDIRPAPGGKRLLFIDGDSIRDTPGGKRLLFIDGDSVRPEPGGIRLLFIDGHDFRRYPNAKILLHVQDGDIRPDPHGKRLMFIDGTVSRAQLVAALYQLKPELFKLTDEETAALKKEMADNAAAEEARLAKDPFPGKYSLLTFSSSDDKKASGPLTVEKKGGFYKLSFKNSKTNETWEGVGFKYEANGDTELWAAFGPENSMAVAKYAADEKTGVLDGKWAPCYLLDTPADFGTETLTPAGANAFTITAGKAPKTQAAYAGTAAFTPAAKDLNGDGKAFSILWTMGDYKVAGLALRVKNTVAAAASSGKEFHLVRFKLDQGCIVGDFLSNTGATGYWNFSKENE